MTFFQWTRQRESGAQQLLCDEDSIMGRVYRSLKPYKTWDETTTNGGIASSEFGAVYNLEFSPDGDMLIGACEKKSIVLFDTNTTNQTKRILNAHTDSVNCVKFLDCRTFATCSDDCTVALWDVRNLNSKLRSLQGHSNWVKNVEYSQKDSLLVTSGFDGSIYAWDINSHTEQGLIYQKVFHTSGLMRCRLSPDASKLVICTTSGYMIVIHNLDLTTLHKDLCGFRPNIYRLMQLGRQFIPQAAKFDHVFTKSQKRNRVELISDFPDKNDAEVILALTIHPEGWCCLSRNISYDEGSEWSCIHNINQPDDRERDFDIIRLNNKRKHSEIEEGEEDRPVRAAETEPIASTSSMSSSSSTVPSAGTSSSVASTSSTTSGRDTSRVTTRESFVPDIWAAEVTIADRACRALRGSRTSNGSTNAFASVYAISSGIVPVVTTPAATAPDTPSPASLIELLENDFNESPPLSEINRSTENRQSESRASATSIGDSSRNQTQLPSQPQKIYKNAKRLMYYIEEPNKGKGFIKEPSFSADGRIVCSPYGNDVRLLAFSENCTSLSEKYFSPGYGPKPMTIFKTISAHRDIVVSTRFSPRHQLLVTGCMRGNIVWHHPDF